MIQLIKDMRKMQTSQEVLNRIGFISEIKKAESYKSVLGLKSEHCAFKKLEDIAWKIAIKKANTVEEIEKCATLIEKNYSGDYDPYEWAEQIRIKAYGIEWYLKRQRNSPAHQEFVNFLDSHFSQ